MPEDKKFPVSCNQCLEEIMQDAVEDKELEWERYGRELPHCQTCLEALKKDMTQPLEPQCSEVQTVNTSNLSAINLRS